MDSFDSADAPVVSERSSRMKVLLLADSYWPVVGGGETHSRMLADCLTRLGAEVVVLTQQRFSDSPSQEQLDGVTVNRVGLAGHKRFGKYLMIPGMVRWLLKHREEYDVIYVCGLRILGAPAVSVARRLNRKVVLRIESCEEMSGRYIYEHLTGIKSVALPLARVLVKWRNSVMLKADAFLAISSVVAREYRDCGVPEEKIRMIFNGVELSFYESRLTDEEKRVSRTSLGLPVERTLLTYTGKLNKGKGIEYLLQALVELRKTHPHVHVVLVGAGQHMYLSLEDELRAFVESHSLQDLVTFTGYVDNVNDYLQASDIFVMPSEMEALCISLIEALAAGLPSVATAVGGIPDVARNGQEALLVPPRDADALVTAIDQLLTDKPLNQRLANAGRARAHSVFGIDSVAQQHLELFSELVSGQRVERS